MSDDRREEYKKQLGELLDGEEIPDDDPVLYEPGVSEVVDHAIDMEGIEINDDTSWWDLVSEFFERGLYTASKEAQKHAVDGDD